MGVSLVVAGCEGHQEGSGDALGADLLAVDTPRGTSPRGWLTVELDAAFVAIPGPVPGPAGGAFILCDTFGRPTPIAVPVANLGEPVVTPLSGRPAILIDVPAG